MNEAHARFVDVHLVRRPDLHLEPVEVAHMRAQTLDGTPRQIPVFREHQAQPALKHGHGKAGRAVLRQSHN